MKKEGIVRIIIFSVMLLMFGYLTVISGYTLFGKDLDFLGTGGGDLYVDGTDLTPVAGFVGAAANGFMVFLNMIAYGVYIAVCGFVLLLPFGLIGLNKKRNVSKKEFRVYLYATVGIYVLAFIIGAILTHFTGLLVLLIYDSIWEVEVLLIVLLFARMRAYHGISR